MEGEEGGGGQETSKASMSQFLGLIQFILQFILCRFRNIFVTESKEDDEYYTWCINDARVTRAPCSVGDPDPDDPYVFGPPGSASGCGPFHHQAKLVVNKSFDFYCFVTSLWLFIFEEWFKCTSVPNDRIHIRIWIRRICMFLGLPDPHPDQLVRGTDPRIRIRTKMSRIPNTGTVRGIKTI